MPEAGMKTVIIGYCREWDAARNLALPGVELGMCGADEGVTPRTPKLCPAW